MLERTEIQVCGIVQSVGFRPFVFGLAEQHHLTGRIRNNERGVLVEVEGEPASVGQFLSDLRLKAPVLARIESIEYRQLAPAHYQDFRIIGTTDNGRKLLSISPDVATCADCLNELFDPRDRRHRYPFINCTGCGPRFTIIESVPYDRGRTTMREFEMCGECRAEYQDPHNRRFHAEPIACAQCGPTVYLTSAASPGELAAGEDALAAATSLLSAGRILAIKGIGGFHLACDALNDDAVQTLRRRKYREDKPFALMAKSLAAVKEHCDVAVDAENLLTSMARPIVLLDRKRGSRISQAAAPRVNSLGFMLPYSPLHYLLVESLAQPLVMTSANISDEPVCYEDSDACARLSQIADYYLMHNRRIHMRADDSVVRVNPAVSLARNPSLTGAQASSLACLSSKQPGRLRPSQEDPRTPFMILRRSRGYAPAPISTAVKFRREILACGAELKNTFCIARNHHAFVSHHIGDLENLETLSSFTAGIEHFKDLFALDPEVVAYDLHPEYLSTKHALAMDEIETKIGVQHHHAHIASCMADNQIEGEVIGVAMDGLGFGADGRLWGGEFLVANFAEARRMAHLEYIPMPGGARAIREPWRMAVAYLQSTFGDNFLDLDIPFVRELDQQKAKVLAQMAASRANSPESSSMGRLFDGVASLVRLRDFTNYEGQAAIELEQITDVTCEGRYHFEIADDGTTIAAQPVIRSIVEDILDQVPPSTVSAKFHAAVADLILEMAANIESKEKLRRVVLSGGVFQNLILLKTSCAKLQAAGFEVFTHGRVPANDGGISLGQAVVANARL